LVVEQNSIKPQSNWFILEHIHIKIAKCEKVLEFININLTLKQKRLTIFARNLELLKVNLNKQNKA